MAAAAMYQCRAAWAGHPEELRFHPEPRLCACADPTRSGRRSARTVRTTEPRGAGGAASGAAVAADRGGLAVRPRPGRRRQVDLLSLGRPAEHSGRADVPSGPGAGGLPGAGTGGAADPSAAPGPAAGILVGDGVRARTTQLAARRSGAGARRLGRAVAATGPERRPAQQASAGRKRLPAAGRPGRGARLRAPGRRDRPPAPAAGERSGRRPARVGGRRQPHPAHQPSLRSGRGQPRAPRPAARHARAAARATASAVRHPLVPHAEEGGAGERSARGDARP